MTTQQNDPIPAKSTVEEIRARFDADVERFSNLETGQSATMDAPLVLDLVSQVAAVTSTQATAMLDIGCGAGNWTVKLLPVMPMLNEVTLVDLSQPMLDRAKQRVQQCHTNTAHNTPLPIETQHGDIRAIELGTNRFDVVVAAAVLHHLRTEAEWSAVFSRIHAAMRPSGVFFVSDLLESAIPAVEQVMRARYASHLENLGGPAMIEKVFAYIEKEDTQRPILWQIDKLREAGFRQFDILHKHGPFGAYIAMK